MFSRIGLMDGTLVALSALLLACGSTAGTGGVAPAVDAGSTPT